MFCIRSYVITIRFIEIYGLVTIWTSMDDGPYWVILLMYGSQDIRHTGFRRLTVVNGTPRFLRCHKFFISDRIYFVYLYCLNTNKCYTKTTKTKLSY